MKNNNDIRLRLEVLEDRIALNGTFRGAIDAAPPSLTPFPFNGLIVHTTTSPQAGSGFRDAFTDVSHLTFAPPAPPPHKHPQPAPPATIVPANQGQMLSFQSTTTMPEFQSQLQSFEATQAAMIDQFISEVNSLLLTLRLQGFIFN